MFEKEEDWAGKWGQAFGLCGAGWRCPPCLPVCVPRSQCSSSCVEGTRKELVELPGRVWALESGSWVNLHYLTMGSSVKWGY